MRFDFKLAWWQSKGQGNKIALVVFCVALGVAARVSIGSFLGQLDRALKREARNLLSADLEISSRAPLDPEKKRSLRGALPEGSRVQDTANFVTMAFAPSTGRSRLVELRAVTSAYPFYGELNLSDQPPDKRSLRSLNLLRKFAARPGNYKE